MTAAATTRTTTMRTTRTRAMTMTTTTTTTMRKAIAAGEGDGGSSKRRCELRGLAGKARAATREAKIARRMCSEATALAEGTAEEARGGAERRVVLSRQAQKTSKTLRPLPSVCSTHFEFDRSDTAWAVGDLRRNVRALL
eukprot:scaffold2588_cov323-Pinguiococcus_pyrenoidosus.AAC.1